MAHVFQGFLSYLPVEPPFHRSVGEKTHRHRPRVDNLPRPTGHTKHFNKEFEIRLPELFDPEETGFPVSETNGIAMVQATFLIDENKRITHISVAWDRAEFATMASALVSVTGLSKLKLFEPGEYVDEFRAGCAGKN